jgi:enamine deaminase RidA (YjgF/YER057c/UK114 family)
MPGNTSGRGVQCCRAGNWVFVQGQVGWTLDAQVVAVGDPASQARQAMDNIKTLMEMAGGKLSDVVRLVVYVTDRSMAVTSSRGPDEWLATFADPVRAQSAIDRFTSSAYDLVIEGESYRTRLKPTVRPPAPPRKGAVAHG